MKTYINRIAVLMIGISGYLLSSCGKDFLDEVPLSDYSNESVLTSEAGFNTFITALHKAARDEMAARDGSTYFYIMQTSNDVASFGNASVSSNNYATLLTPTANAVSWVWSWAYNDMLLIANTIIDYAQRPELANIWSSESTRNAVIAEAKFFRAYTHNVLANLYGDVPVIDRIYTAPKNDFERTPRMQVLDFAREDQAAATQDIQIQQAGHLNSKNLWSMYSISDLPMGSATLLFQKFFFHPAFQTTTPRRDHPLEWLAFVFCCYGSVTLQGLLLL